ncbi:glycosyltransferase family 2 protein [bacterium]|nr:glycosyltransferase family 2 protein [bacterium]MCP5462971.1 glycosyltransferase family 2 protein [bacterium]
MSNAKDCHNDLFFCVIIPAYNEEKNIAALIASIKRYTDNIVVIDDGSQDATVEHVKKAGALCIEHTYNRGKGAALEDGYRYARDNGFQYVLTMDGDGQHSPDDIPKFIETIKTTGADIIVGNRMDDTHEMPILRYLTNKFTSWVISILAGQKIYDTQCGYRMAATKVFSDVIMTTHNYDSESEILVKASRAGYTISSVSIQTIYGERKSNIRPFRDGIRFFSLVFRLMFK